MAKTKQPTDRIVDLDEKLRNAKAAVEKNPDSPREQADLKLIEQEAAAERLNAKHPAQRAEKESKLDKALKDSFPGSDPVSFIQGTPGKKDDAAG